MNPSSTTTVFRDTTSTRSISSTRSTKGSSCLRFSWTQKRPIIAPCGRLSSAGASGHCDKTRSNRSPVICCLPACIAYQPTGIFHERFSDNFLPFDQRWYYDEDKETTTTTATTQNNTSGLQLQLPGECKEPEAHLAK